MAPSPSAVSSNSTRLTRNSLSGRLINETKSKLSAPVTTFEAVRPFKKRKTTVLTDEEPQTSSSGSRNISKCPPVIDEDEDYTDQQSSNFDSSDVESPNPVPSEGADTIEMEDGNGVTTKEDMAKLQKEWTAPIYALFKPIPDVNYVDSRPCHTFLCAATVCKYPSRGVRRFLDKKDAKSTSNMRKHAKKCWGPEIIAALANASSADDVRKLYENGSLQSGSIATDFERSAKVKASYSHHQHTKAETRAEIIRWVTESLRPLEILKDRGFISLMKTGRPECYIPSLGTVSRDIKLAFARTRNRIAKMLQDYPGALNFATAAWTSPNCRAYLAVTVHFEQKAAPVSMLLDIVEVPYSHTGPNLAAAFAEILQEFGIADKILSITCNNTPKNEVMARELAKVIPEFAGTSNLTRCFTHIINLVAKTIIRVFDLPTDKENLDEAEQELRNLAGNIEFEELETATTLPVDDEDDLADSTEGWVDERATLSVMERKELDQSVRPVRVVLLKLRELSFVIIHVFAEHDPKWFETLRFLKLKKNTGPRDVITKWNSMYDMVCFAIQYRAAIDKMAATQSNGLQQYELSEDEWEIVGQLEKILQIFKHATSFFSRATPSLATVIPAMDYIDEVLMTRSINDNKFLPSICAAANLAKKTLNQHYDLTEDSKLYRIAMVLHPRYKLEYFRNANWDKDWMMETESFVRDKYEELYRDADVEIVDIGLPKPSQVKKSDSENIFDNLPALSTPINIDDELTRYLREETQCLVIDPLAWWTAQRHVYPHLSRMALDYLSIPATSVDVERVFSKGRELLSHRRNGRLSSQSIRATMCLNAWGLLGFVKDQDVLAVGQGNEVAGDDDVELEAGWDTIKKTER